MQPTITSQQMEDFHRYARFLCDTFDITIELDTTKAETTGKVIRLPNVSGLTPRELDMMYSILLHEICHIRHSDFSEEAFLNLKTQAHASLSNAIEDARVENLTMKDYDGARAIFENLYCDYAVDKQLMQKLFKMDIKKRPSIFHSLGLYLHTLLVQCNSAPLVKQMGRTHERKIRHFLHDNNLMQDIDPEKVKTWDDVVELTNKVYDAFVKDFADKSQQLDLKSDVAAKKKAQDALTKVKQALQEMQGQSDTLQKDIAAKYDELQAFEDANREVLEPLRDTMQDAQQEQNQLSQEVQMRKRIDSLEQQMAAADKQIQHQQQQAQKLQEDLQQLQQKLDSGLNGHNKPLSDTQRENLQAKIKSRQAQVDKAQQKEAQAQTTKTELEQQLKQANSDLNKDMAGMSEEALQQQIQALQQQIGEAQEQINQVMQHSQDIVNQINSLESQLNELQEKAAAQVMQTLLDVDKTSSEKFGTPLFGDFVETPGWEGADQAQRDFDEKATKETGRVVRNGGKVAGLSGSNLRDLQLLIDKTQHKVAEINLCEIFKEKINLSKMPQATPMLVTNSMTDQAVRHALGDIRPHVALTQEFDEVIMQNDSKQQQQVLSLEKQYAGFINQVTKVFAKKLRFSKKDFWKGGREEGELDARNLWKLPTRMGDDFFEENNPKFVNKLAASILVDISGSQDTAQSEYGKFLKVLSLALSKGLTASHIRHEVLGFHAPVCEEMRQMQASHLYNRRSNKLQTIVYKTFNQKDTLGVGNMEIACSDNSDSESIRVAIKRLAKERAKSRALFIITDGKPYLTDADIAIMDEDLKKVLREAVAQKVQVFAFGFAPNGSDFYGSRFCHIQNLGDVVTYCDKMMNI